MSPTRRTRQDTPHRPDPPPARRRRPEPIGSPRCPLKHTAGQRHAAAQVRNYLRAVWLWQYLTTNAQRILEEWLLHAGWKKHHVAIYQATLADGLGLCVRTAHNAEHLLYTAGYGKRHLWRDNPTRLRRGVWLTDLLGLLLHLLRLSFPNRQALLRHLIRAALADPLRAARHLRRYPQAQPLWEAVLGEPISTGNNLPVVRSHKRVREVDAAGEAPLPLVAGHEHSSPPSPAHQTPAPDPSPSTPSAGVLRFAPARGDGDGIPATNSSASGGRGEDQPAQTDRPSDGQRTRTLADLAARAALLRRFESDAGAALRSDLQLRSNVMLYRPLPKALAFLRRAPITPALPRTEDDADFLARQLRAPITAALGCTDEDADFLARRYIARLRDERRRAPHGPPPVPRTVRTDATGREWVLEYEQPP